MSSAHTITFDGVKEAGEGMHRVAKYGIDCTCGNVALGDGPGDRDGATKLHEAHLPDPLPVSPTSRNERR